MDLRQFPQNPKALLIEAKDKIIALESQLARNDKSIASLAEVCRVTEEHYDEYVAELKRELAEANSKLDKYSGMCVSCPDMGMTLVVERLERELAEANDKARLQRALDRIKQASNEAFALYPDNPIVGTYPRDAKPRWYFYGDNWAEAAEQAAGWLERQKEAAHE